jgi:hypothetical protein
MNKMEQSFFFIIIIIVLCVSFNLYRVSSFVFHISYEWRISYNIYVELLMNYIINQQIKKLKVYI